jgi:hypothetical protein
MKTMFFEARLLDGAKVEGAGTGVTIEEAVRLAKDNLERRVGPFRDFRVTSVLPDARDHVTGAESS